MVTYIFATFSADWFKIVDAKGETKSNIAFFFNSRANNSGRSGPIRPRIKFIQDFMVTNILTEFGADWLIVVDARVKIKRNILFLN